MAWKDVGPVIGSAGGVITIGAGLVAAIGWLVSLNHDVSDLKERVAKLEARPAVVAAPDPAKQACVDLAKQLTDTLSNDIQINQARKAIGCPNTTP